MQSIVRPLLAFIFTLLLLSSVSLYAEIDAALIPYEKFTLENGLTVIVHEDHKAPIVAVNIWYHVGAKDEVIGKTGFAHLYEHLMFNGSEHFDDEYFIPFRKVGATDMNGTTNSDRTNYFANVPSTAVDVALWMESDRMGHLLGAVTQEKLDNQRDVVQNEKRQGENSPYGKLFDLLAENGYPSDHPYSRSVIGSMEDLNAASLEDVHAWFKQYYGPNNAVLALVGDITVEKAKALVKKYFAHIPASDPLVKQKSWVAKRSGDKRVVAYDRVPQERLYMIWNIPEYGHIESNQLDVVATILGSGKNSRLYKRLVYQDQLATGVNAFTYARELSGWFGLQVDIKSGIAREKVEAIVNEELAAFLREGVSKEDLERAKISYRAGIIRGLERIGGMGGKSDILIMGEVYKGDPAYYQRWLHDVEGLTKANADKAARKWLSDGRLILEYRPFEKYTHSDKDVDRKKGVPEVMEMPAMTFPEMQRDTLSNGLNIILAERHEIPTVGIQLSIDAGYAADKGRILGTSSFMLSMLDEGTKRYDSLQISRQLERLGAGFDTGSTLDNSYVVLDSLKENLSESIKLFSEMCLLPSFPQKEIDRLKGQWSAHIQQEKAEPKAMALRTLPPLIYGKDHAYAIPFTGSGTEQSIAQLQRDDLVKFHQDWFRPDSATLIIVGDTSLSEIKPLLEKAFGHWKVPATEKLTKNITQVALPDKTRVFLIDKPEAVQTHIMAAQVLPQENLAKRFIISRMNDIIGGNFTARLNMNLREDKGWAYGARSSVLFAKGQGPFVVSVPVQTDKTVESIQEIIKEYKSYLGPKPATQDELDESIDNEIRRLPGEHETSGAVLSTIDYLQRFNYPDDYVKTYQDKIKSITLEQVRQSARDVIKLDQFTWVIVGDLSKIEQGVRNLKLGEVTVLDGEGNKVR